MLDQAIEESPFHLIKNRENVLEKYRHYLHLDRELAQLKNNENKNISSDNMLNMKNKKRVLRRYYPQYLIQFGWWFLKARLYHAR